MQRAALAPDMFQGHVSLEITDTYITPWRLQYDRLPFFWDAGFIERAGVPSGVRIRISTDSRNITLHTQPDTINRTYDLVINNNYVATCTQNAGQETVRFADIDSNSNIVEIYLPNPNSASPLRLTGIEIDDDATITAEPDRRLRWVHYGSSISQCVEAHSPSRTWPAVVARKLNLNLTSLGYGGQCHMDPMVARMIRDLPVDIISLKLGINICGAASLNLRTFGPAAIGSIATIRDKHPNTPLLVISPIYSPGREHNTNIVDMNLAMMRDQLNKVVTAFQDAGDRNIHYFDGLALLDPKEADIYMPDHLHPDGDGYELLADRMIEQVFSTLDIPKPSS